MDYKIFFIRVFSLYIYIKSNLYKPSKDLYQMLNKK